MGLAWYHISWMTLGYPVKKLKFTQSLEVSSFIYMLHKGLVNDYVMLSCLYAKFRWLISHVQLSFQPQSVKVLRRLTES